MIQPDSPLVQMVAENAQRIGRGYATDGARAAGSYQPPPAVLRMCGGCGQPAYQRGIAGPLVNPLCPDFENLLDEFIAEWNA